MSSESNTGRQSSSLESFLDDYQSVRLVVGVAGVLILIVFVVGRWWQWGSPVPNILAVSAMAAHAAWCKLRHIRAPKLMLVIDITLVGASLLSIPDLLSMMTAFYGLLALVVVLFTERWWQTWLLVYLTAWYSVGYLNGSGLTIDSVASLTGSFVAVAAVVALMVKLRLWMGRLDGDRSQMLGTVSHELRNNLTGVVGLTDVLASMGDLEPAEARELLGLANQQAVDATEIVEDLLTASRIERAALTTGVEDVDVNTEARTVSRRFQGSETEIGLFLDDEMPSAIADGLRVRQIVRNLLSNAVRYGGPQLAVITHREGNGVVVTVRDNGDGVPAEDEDTIFLPYRRSTAGRKSTSSVGLGLWICHQLARSMNGDVTYQRRNGQTEFSLRLPATRDSATTEAQPAPIQATTPERSCPPATMSRYTAAVCLSLTCG